MRRATLSAAVLTLALGLFGCDGPCQSLAERICSCEPNQTERQSCELKVQLRLNEPVTLEEEATCSELLDSCTCEAIADEDFLACGIFDAP